MDQDIKTVSIEDEEYPKQLKEIKNPPKLLYYIGNLSAAEKPCFGIVGTRRCSVYGKQIAMNFASNLSDAGLVIVSGLTPGIDTFSHQAIVEKQKQTIAVLGTGLDEKTIYPQSNLGLSRKIIENNGCLISEYPNGTHGARFTFPNRNRIISGLSMGILIVEAKQKSGALITANWAKKQKRKIFAVPGSVYSQNSQGCHFAIKQGAKLAENAQDILKELNKQTISINFEKQITGDTEQENLVLRALQQGPAHIDEIAKITKLFPSEINSAIAVLEIKDIIKNFGGNIYALTG
ncbi:DNA-processing protein DprA [Candidatus Parcubacteria bacterium]|jgi:DNA processing protein|nr:DNA-processing protein DprA [Candidatus Parcubacteria bacterium]